MNVGIDTIRVVGAVEGEPDWTRFTKKDEKPRDVSSGRPYRTGTVVLYDCGVPVLVKQDSDGIWRARWEISLPKWRYGHNLWPMGLADAWAALLTMYQEAGEYVAWAVAFEDMTVMRIDIDRHFHVGEHADAILRNLHKQRVDPRWKRALYDKGNLATGLTISRKDDAWQAKLYDKEAQLRRLATSAGGTESSLLHEAIPEARGILRLETTHRKTALRGGRMNRLGVLTTENLEIANRRLFKRVGFGRVAGGSHPTEDALRRLCASDDAQLAAKVVGMCVLQGQGLEIPHCTKTVKLWQNIAKRYEIPAIDLSDLGGPTFQLDYESGGVLIDGSGLDVIQANGDGSAQHPGKRRAGCLNHRPAGADAGHASHACPGQAMQTPVRGAFTPAPDPFLAHEAPDSYSDALRWSKDHA